jgi:CRP-like cAMP-binding protein
MLQTSPDFKKTLSYLGNSPFFSKLKPEIIEDMLKDFTLITIKKSTILGDNMKYFYIILKGRLRLTQVDPVTGKSVTIFLLHEGDGFDIFPLLDGKEHITQPIAVDDMIVIRASSQKVRDWITIHPDFNATFLPYIGEKLREMESFSESIVFHDTLTRLANLILKFTEEKKDDNDGHYKVKLINNLSHEVLAELIGTSRSVLSTQMQKLKKDGIIAGKKGSLVVKNIKKLKEKL